MKLLCLLVNTSFHLYLALFPGDGLKELKLLKILNLASNRICDVRALELKTCTNLVFLDLSNNNLKTIKVAFFLKQ